MLDKIVKKLMNIKSEDIFAITVGLIILSGMIYSISLSIRMFL